MAHELWELADRLRRMRIVDLTQMFAPGIPHWSGYEDEARRDVLRHADHGFWAISHTLAGAWGTHVDAPVHMFPGGRAVADIRPDEMIMPLAVIDISERAARDSDAVVAIEDVKRWEDRNGPIPAGAFVALRTGWAKRWPHDAAMDNKDPAGAPHTPGWSLEVLRLLYEDRGITASGHETKDPDPGSSTGRPIPTDRPLPEVMHEWYACEAYILSRDRYEIEMLTNLDQVPEAGAMVIVSFPKAGAAPNFPARVLAICPA